MSRTVRGPLARRLHTLVWLLPASGVKNRLLRRFGHVIARDASLGSCVVLTLGHLHAGERALIAAGSFVRGIREMVLSDDAAVGPWNILTAHPAFQHEGENGVLWVGAHAVITSRHSIDCSGRVVLGAFSSVGGHGTQVLSHEVDFTGPVQTCADIEIGDHSFVGTRCTVLSGARLPDRSVLAAGSLLRRGPDEGAGLYTGSPARRKQALDGAWFHRPVGQTRSLCDRSGQVLHGAF
ncbi:acyltransferase [Actinomycetospora atypica]|uniref:Acyltransferase n=1 Tax=Actinomycetospora atypica TaxID=1290095 RepID=A0ABV9YNS9_9PSEU